MTATTQMTETHACHSCQTTHDGEDMIQCTICDEYFCIRCACDCDSKAFKKEMGEQAA
jgi:hypothetical protein